MTKHQVWREGVDPRWFKSPKKDGAVTLMGQGRGTNKPALGSGEDWLRKLPTSSLEIGERASIWSCPMCQVPQPAQRDLSQSSVNLLKNCDYHLCFEDEKIEASGTHPESHTWGSDRAEMHPLSLTPDGTILIARPPQHISHTWRLR